jgi:hypothetical protein
MSKLLDEPLSLETAKQIHSKPKTRFENAYKAALSIEGATYVQGFLVYGHEPIQPIEHGWVELDERIIDPTLPHLGKGSQDLYYFTAQSLTRKKLKAIIEEAKEDYPEDDPLPVYGKPPYEYYGDLMLGGQEYVTAYAEAEAKCAELNQARVQESN